MDLLLLADPDEQRIATYIHNGSIYKLLEDEQVLGICVLVPRQGDTAEIANLAVAEDAQGKGLGTRLLQYTIDAARQAGYHYLKVGTGNSSLDQLAFYQKNGFRIVGVLRDYFIKHYDKPIVENGIPCRDMILLEMDLHGMKG
ncbi:GNAT family N-acetyltransferase [Paenibacillus zeisoli]|uniref:GNAT family N-acetyltransferase n=1 Tax=Paenibacillus zeisoli TaxID=2496267 RepID=A0A433X795_9BACL|nr:GNAT family N-acetyltransferase [Paenibacillus zeisoli]RUT29929.1 GNAT family N-acetyltransferase [Paenibacillus zeisoli]